MKILLQSLRDGKSFIEEVPMPQIRKGYYLIQSSRSLISTGTEKMLINFGKAGWFDKITQQPDKVQQVWQKIQNEGFLHTMKQVQYKMDQPIPLGYCNVGTIIETHRDTTSYQIGQRVVNNGYHAEINAVPKNLCCYIPDNVTDDEACFAIPAAIGLQGIRLLKVELGEKIVVMGLGLIGILSAQILMAHGCEVLGIDTSDSAILKAKELGINCIHSNQHTSEQLFQSYFDNKGADAVLITASSSEPLIIEAGKLCRQRGRIVLVGVVSNEISRDVFYKKELSFQVACSYGPGRYDPTYEEHGIDYPYGFVRWTEKRNIETAIQLLSDKKLKVLPLINKYASFENSINEFYAQMDNLQFGNIIQYLPGNILKAKSIRYSSLGSNVNSQNRIGIIGSGNFVQSILLPSLKNAGAQISMICSQQPQTGVLAKKYSISEWVVDPDAIFESKEIDTVIICNRHHQHGQLAIKALESGKNVFVEKPLCLKKEEWDVISTMLQHGGKLTVGYNRRYSAYIDKVKNTLKGFENKISINYTINAGHVDPNHWVQNTELGGGRILGEVCHFIDLCIYLIQSKVKSVHAIALGLSLESNSDTLSIQLKFQNGSLACIQYFSNGSKKATKEDLQIYCSGKILKLSNFKKLKGFGLHYSQAWFPKLDKGHENQFLALVENSNSFYSSEKTEQILHASEVCFAVIDSLQTNKVVHL